MHSEQGLIVVKMAPKLYYTNGSPPVRAVLMTADALGVDLDLVEVNAVKGEQLKPQYLKVKCSAYCLLNIHFIIF